MVNESHQHYGMYSEMCYVISPAASVWEYSINKMYFK